MPPPVELDPRRLRELHSQGLSSSAIAAELGVSQSTISRQARRLGLSFDRAKTKAATEARVVDAKAKRAQLVDDLLDDAQRLRQRAWSKYPIPVEGPRGTKIVLLDLPPLDQVRNAYTALGIAVDKSMRIEQHDADTQGLAAVDAWLRDMIGD